jgi:hypothetical protein
MQGQCSPIAAAAAPAVTNFAVLSCCAGILKQQLKHSRMIEEIDTDGYTKHYFDKASTPLLCKHQHVQPPHRQNHDCCTLP